MIWSWLSLPFLVAAAAGCVYVLAAAAAVLRFARQHRPASSPPVPVTILKPLHGAEDGLYERLASFCRQDYAAPVQIVCGVQDPADPAVAVVKRLRESFPDCAIDLSIETARHGMNRKISNLIGMERLVRYEAVVLADSDMVVGPDWLGRVMASLAEPGVGAVTCLYHGLPTGSVWARLGTLAIDNHFLPNVIVGLRLGLARPCFGSTIALTRDTLAAIGGFEAFTDRLADDNAIGEAVRATGRRVAVPPFSIGHVCGERSARELLLHELRWARTIKAVDPAGHAGAVVTHPLPLALIAALMGSGLGLALVAAAIIGRIALCAAVERAFGLERHPYWLVPCRDLLSFVVFVWSFLGSGVAWQGHRYRVAADGTLIQDRSLPSS